MHTPFQQLHRYVNGAKKTKSETYQLPTRQSCKIVFYKYISGFNFMIDWLFLNRDYYMVLTTIIMVVYTIIVCTVVRN